MKSLLHVAHEAIGRIKTGMDAVIRGIIKFLMVFLVIVVFLQVFSRYVLQNPYIWTEEAARYLFVWIVYLSVYISFVSDQHLTISIFTSMMPAALRRIALVLRYFFLVVFFVAVITMTPKFLGVAMLHTSPTLGLRMGIVYVAFPFSVILMFVEVVHRGVSLFHSRYLGRRE